MAIYQCLLSLISHYHLLTSITAIYKFPLPLLIFNQYPLSITALYICSISLNALSITALYNCSLQFPVFKCPLLYCPLSLSFTISHYHSLPSTTVIYNCPLLLLTITQNSLYYCPLSLPSTTSHYHIALYHCFLILPCTFAHYHSVHSLLQSSITSLHYFFIITHCLYHCYL